jgi:hypothetical protein
MDNTELRSLLELAREYGVLQLKYKDIEVHLSPRVEVPMATSIPITPQNVELSNEDMLFYSVEAPKEESK